MMETSSSEDEDEGLQTPSSFATQDSLSTVHQNGGPRRALSPAMSVDGPAKTSNGVGRGPALSATEIEEKKKKEEEQRKANLQLYVFVLRSISYPFNAQQSGEMTKRNQKVTQDGLEELRTKLDSFLKGETSIPSDEAFQSSVKKLEMFLKSERTTGLVAVGGLSQHDCKEYFRNKIKKLDGLDKEAVMTSWMAKYDLITKEEGEKRRPGQRLTVKMLGNEVLSKEQLFDLFQQILDVKKFEHQLLYNAMQLDSSEEQISTIKKELEAKKEKISEIEKNQSLMPKFMKADMGAYYMGELNTNLNKLKTNLEEAPAQQTKKIEKPSGVEGDDTPITKVSKSDIVLEFKIEVVVLEVRNLKSVVEETLIYCTSDVNGGTKKVTGQVAASSPYWSTPAEFSTTNPTPVVKVKLFTDSTSMLALDDKELGKVTINPTPSSSKAGEWYKATVAKGSEDQGLRMKVQVRMEKPMNMRHCGYMYAMGKTTWKTWRKRYFVLVQVAELSFAICSHNSKKMINATKMMQLDGHTVDYIAPEGAMFYHQNLQGGKFFFNTVKEGESVLFATDTEKDAQNWVVAFYQATGQAHKPAKPENTKGGKTAASNKKKDEPDGERKHGMEEYIAADPQAFDQHELLEKLQNLSLEWREQDPFVSLGWLTPGQLFVIEEYCSRYGVRGCLRHLYYLDGLLQKCENKLLIDPSVLHLSYTYCASHIYATSAKDRPSGGGTVTQSEKEQFMKIKTRLRTQVDSYLGNFRFSFPFGRPVGALKATLSLMEKVLMKDLTTAVPPNEFKSVIKKSLENASQVHFDRISEEGKVKSLIANPKDKDVMGQVNHSPARKLEDLIRLADMCVDLMRQNVEFYEEFQNDAAYPWFVSLIVEHSEKFWTQFGASMDSILKQQPKDNWDSFPLFQIINDYLITDDKIRNGKFHQHLRDTFAPQVVRYVDLMESNIGNSISKGFEKERWEIKGQVPRPCVGKPSNGCATSVDLFWKLGALQTFIRDLHWPDPEFGNHLNQRLKQMASDMIDSSIQRTFAAFDANLKKGLTVEERLDASAYVVPNELVAMINVLVEAKVQSQKLCTDDGDTKPDEDAKPKKPPKIDEKIDKISANMRGLLSGKLVSVLDKTLGKLKDHDEGNLIGGMMSFAKKKANVSGSASGVDTAKTYISFVRLNMDILARRISEDAWVLKLAERWYFEQNKKIMAFLTERANGLHPFQCTCVAYIAKKMRREYKCQGVAQDKLMSATVQQIGQRILTEEVTLGLTKPKPVKGEEGSDEDSAGEGSEDSDDERRERQIDNKRKAKARGDKINDEEERLQRQQSKAKPGPQSQQGPPQQGKPNNQPPKGNPQLQKAPSQAGNGPPQPAKGPPQQGKAPPQQGKGAPPQGQNRPKPKKMDSDSSDSEDEGPKKKPQGKPQEKPKPKPQGKQMPKIPQPAIPNLGKTFGSFF